jgi:AhpD family alkylhydroperoxidase
MEDVNGSTLRLLEIVNAERGDISNMIQTMAQSPRTLDGYLRFHRALAGGPIEAKIREQIALTVAQMNRCDYSLAEHAALAGHLGLTNEEILASREARAEDERTGAILKFARDLVVRSGKCSVVELREAGLDDAEIVDIIALVALNVFENWFNVAAQTELDLTKGTHVVRAA